MSITTSTPPDEAYNKLLQNLILQTEENGDPKGFASIDGKDHVTISL